MFYLHDPTESVCPCSKRGILHIMQINTGLGELDHFSTVTQAEHDMKPGLEGSKATVFHLSLHNHPIIPREIPQIVRDKDKTSFLIPNPGLFSPLFPLSIHALLSSLSSSMSNMYWPSKQGRLLYAQLVRTGK